jgi:hypothetical protein
MSSTNQFNTANNAGFVTAYIGALASYVKPLTTIANDIATGYTGFTALRTRPDSSNLGDTGNIIIGATAVYAAGIETMNAINTFNTTDNQNSDDLYTLFVNVVNDGITFVNRVKDLELDYFNAYGNTATGGPTGLSRGNAWNMQNNEIENYYSTWNSLNNTLATSSNAFNTWITQNINSFLGSTGRAAYPFNGIDTISKDQATVSYDVQSLQLFLTQNDNANQNNSSGICTPSFATSTQYNAALKKYNTLNNDLSTLITDMQGFIGSSGLGNTAQ